MKRKLQVFVSSTYLDLQEERQAAVQAILRAGHVPAGMELFAAGDRSQWDTITKWIDESDVFMLILGGRYGSLEPESGKSYTHLEYEYAVEHKKPVFAAVMSDECLKARVKKKGIEVAETANSAKLGEFRKDVDSRTRRTFEDVKDVTVIAFESLSEFASRPELSGWVRAEDAADPKAALDQITSLSQQNAELKLQLEAALAAAGNAERDPSTIAVQLSTESKRLLNLSAGGSGRINFSVTLGGMSVFAGDGDLMESGLHGRAAAVWRAAASELVEKGLATELSSSNFP